MINCQSMKWKVTCDSSGWYIQDRDSGEIRNVKPLNNNTLGYSTEKEFNRYCEFHFYNERA